MNFLRIYLIMIRKYYDIEKSTKLILDLLLQTIK